MSYGVGICSWMADGGLIGLVLGWSAPLVVTALSFLILGGLVSADRPINALKAVGLRPSVAAVTLDRLEIEHPTSSRPGAGSF